MSSPTARRLLLFDFDGTLAPIRPRPGQARLPAATRRVLQRLAAQADTQVGIVSGRSLEDVRQRVGLPGLLYVGNHGLEIWRSHQRWVHPQALRLSPLIDQICGRLMTAFAEIPGVEIENKNLTASVHVRRVRPALVPRVARLTQTVTKDVAGSRKVFIRPGKKIFDIRPSVDWHKGSAVNQLLKAAPRATLVLYAGDDLTDEDVFRSLPLPHLTIRIGRTGTTHARARLSAEDVYRLLLRLERYPQNVEKWLIE